MIYDVPERMCGMKVRGAYKEVKKWSFVCVCVILPPDVSAFPPSRPHDVCTCMQVSSASDVPATVVVWRKPLSAHTNKKKKPKKLKGFGFCFNRFLALVCWWLVIGLGYDNWLRWVKMVG